MVCWGLGVGREGSGFGLRVGDQGSGFGIREGPKPFNPEAMSPPEFQRRLTKGLRAF